MNCVLASEELWVPATLPSENVGLIGGEVPYKSYVRLCANGLGPKWDSLLCLCLQRGFLKGCEMDMLDHGCLHWVVILAHMVLVPLLAK